MVDRYKYIIIKVKLNINNMKIRKKKQRTWWTDTNI